MKTEASEIIFISLKQHFQNEPDDRIMELTIKLQRRQMIFHDRKDAHGFLLHGLYNGFARAAGSH